MNIQNLLNSNHKVKKIKIHNNNTYSLMSEIIIKITLNDIGDSDTVRFTYNDELLPHQSIDNDYFVRIPNILNKDIDIYAHYFSSDLYEYEESTEIFSIYDFRELYDFLQKDVKEGLAGTNSYYCYNCGYFENSIVLNNQNIPICNSCGSTNVLVYNDEYTIQADYDNNRTYDYSIDEIGRLTVQSKLQDSVTTYKNPNYKNYNSKDENKTEKGYFPLSSKYRVKTNTQAPQINQNIDAYWETDNPKNPIFWEVRINRRGLSPLISNGVEDGQGNIIKDIPLNVYLDYEYVPTSTEYHQHFYGIEGQTTEPKTMNIFEGTNLHTINNKFNQDNYKLINWGNPYDNRHTMFVNHDLVIPVDFNDFVPSKINNAETCDWSKNICYNYWAYTPLISFNSQDNRGYCSKIINNLKDGAWYTLKFYIFLPSYLNSGLFDSAFDVQVITNYLSDEPIIYKIDDNFIKQDNVLKDQWIYHEVPFEATESIMIRIYGPNFVSGFNNTIFFTNMLLQKMPRYSPTIKYTNRGIFLLDTDDNTLKNNYIYKPISEKKAPTNVDDSESDISWTSIKSSELPIPFGKVYISSNNNMNLYYDRLTTKLYYEHLPFDEDSNNPPIFQCETREIGDSHRVLVTNNTNIINVIEDEETENKILTIAYDDFITAVKGPNNKFVISFKDSNNVLINDGNAIASICDMNKQLLTFEDDTTLTLERQNVESGYVIWNADLTEIPINNENEFYYLKIEYTNECSYKNETEYIRFIVIEEELYINIDSIRGATEENGTYIVNDSDNFPLKIIANIHNQNTLVTDRGYCELSINDELNQSTLVDYDGECDFYLDLEDISCGTYTIKIEYYREYNNALCFKYFDLTVVEGACDARPRIPIEFKIFKEGKITSIGDENYFECDYNDCILFDITTGPHSEFLLEVWRDPIYNNDNEMIDGELIIHQNILNVNQLDYTFFDSEFSEVNKEEDVTHYYLVKTSNMEDTNGNIIKNKYRDHTRTLCVTKKANTDRYEIPLNTN